MSVPPDRQVKGERTTACRHAEARAISIRDGWRSRALASAKFFEMVEEVRQAGELIEKARRAMIPDPPVRTFPVNADRALDAVEVVADKAPWLGLSTASRHGPKIQILSRP
jgi:hypothetical protein